MAKNIKKEFKPFVSEVYVAFGPTMHESRSWAIVLSEPHYNPDFIKPENIDKKDIILAIASFFEEQASLTKKRAEQSSGLAVSWAEESGQYTEAAKHWKEY